MLLKAWEQMNLMFWYRESAENWQRVSSEFKCVLFNSLDSNNASVVTLDLCWWSGLYVSQLCCVQVPGQAA